MPENAEFGTGTSFTAKLAENLLASGSLLRMLNLVAIVIIDDKTVKKSLLPKKSNVVIGF